MNLKAFLALTLLAPVSLALALGIHVEPDENNVTQDRLEGIWVADAGLRERMGVKMKEVELEFVVDPSFLADVPAKYDEFFKDKQVFEAGRMVSRRNGKASSFPYLLTTHSGNPHLVFFRERGGDALGDAESSILVVVPANEKSGDLLFMGGDFDNEPFRAFRRKAEANK